MVFWEAIIVLCLQAGVGPCQDVPIATGIVFRAEDVCQAFSRAQAMQISAVLAPEVRLRTRCRRIEISGA